MKSMTGEDFKEILKGTSDELILALAEVMNYAPNGKREIFLERAKGAIKALEESKMSDDADKYFQVGELYSLSFTNAVQRCILIQDKFTVFQDARDLDHGEHVVINTLNGQMTSQHKGWSERD